MSLSKGKGIHILVMMIVVATAIAALTGCTNTDQSEDGATVDKYTQITQEDAKAMMAEDDDHIILDVRTQEEFNDEHIPDAICIPNEDIGSKQPEELPDLNQLILVYCRSGNRSKQASQKLYDMGYTNVYEFGGIVDWTGETVKE